MKSPTYGKLLLAFILAWGVAPRTGLAQDTDVEAALRERAQRFWQARVAGDFGTVYDILPPEERQLTERETYATYQSTEGPFRYLSAEVGEVAVDKDVGWVFVTFTVTPGKYPGIPPQQVKTWDVWLKRDAWNPVPRGGLDRFPSRPPEERPADEEASLRARIDTYWQAMEKDDRATVYEHLVPAARQGIPRDEFLSRKAQYLYVAHTIDWVEVTGNQGKAMVSFSRKINDPSVSKMDPVEMKVADKWVKVDGQWYRTLTSQ